MTHVMVDEMTPMQISRAYSVPVTYILKHNPFLGYDPLFIYIFIRYILKHNPFLGFDPFALIMLSYMFSVPTVYQQLVAKICALRNDEHLHTLRPDTVTHTELNVM